MTPRISRVVYVLLAVFFGTLGIHNFIAGYKTKGIIQLLMGTIGWVTLGLLPFAAQIWAWIEAFTVTTDVDGIPMSSATQDTAMSDGTTEPAAGWATDQATGGHPRQAA